jgi:hypothetical protein
VDNAVRAEGDIEALLALARLCQPVVHVGALKRRRNPRLHRKPRREVNRLVANINADHLCAKPRDAERILSRVTEEMDDPPTSYLAEHFQLLRTQRASTLAKVARLVALVAVVRARGGVPREPVHLS